MSQTTWQDFKRVSIQRKTASKSKKKSLAWSQEVGIQEINCGAIAPTELPGVYQIQANTMGGLRNFHAVEEADSDLQSDVTELFDSNLDSMALIRQIFDQWKDITTKASFSAESDGADLVIADLPYGRSIQKPITVTEPAIQSILRELRNPALTIEEARKHILAAEVLDFNGSEREELCPLLHAFAMTYRDSNVAEDLVAVGAAIRKLVAYLPSESLGSLADLLTTGRRAYLPLEVELEVAKTILRKLSTHPPATNDSEPVLADRLMDVASTYLNPRLLAREKHGATALNAMLSLMLLRSPHVAEMIDLVRRAATDWFTQLACRRTARLLEDLRRRVSAADFPVMSHHFTEFLENFRNEES